MSLGEPRDTSRRHVRCVARLVFPLALIGSLWTTTVLADNAASRIDIGPGPLQAALEQLADQTQLQILYDPVLVRGLSTHGVNGAKTPSEALKQLLATTGITFEFTGDDAVALHTVARSGSGGAHSYTEPSHPSTVTIHGNRIAEGSYSSDTTLAGMKIDESAMIVPVTTQSLTQQVLRDQQVTRLEDILEYVSGTEIVPDGQSALGFEMRGFPTYQYYVDGVRTSPDVHHDAFRDMANIDRAEIIKGPASLLYGRMEPGGLVNIITKQPLSTPLLSLEQQVGSFGHRRTQLDAGGPLRSDDSLLYRFNAAWEQGGSFRDISSHRRFFLSPVVTWALSQKTSETAYLEYLNSHDPSDSGLPTLGYQLPSVPIERSLDEGGEIQTTDLRFGLKGTHVFADGWTMSHHLEGRWLHAPQSPQIALATDGIPTLCQPGHCPVKRQLVSIPVSRGNQALASVDLTGGASIWRTRHSVLMGFEYFQSLEQNELLSRTDASLTTDLYDPAYEPIPVSLLQDPDRESHTLTRERWAAGYVQYQAALWDRLYLLSGWRKDKVWENVTGTTSPPAGLFTVLGTGSNTVRATKQREGILWRPARWLSLYANYSENFGATPGLYASATGDVGLYLPVQSAYEWEAGVKVESPYGRASAAAAWFDLTKTNISSPLLEPALNESGALFLGGTARNRGLEVDLRGEIVPNLQLSASYAYIDSRIANVSSPNSIVRINGYELEGLTGNRLFGAALNGGSVWGTYRVANGLFGGLKVGVGAIIRGVRAGDNINDYQLPGFAKVNVMAAYSWSAAGTRMSVQLNVDNLFDKRYFESISGTHTVMPGSPRSWIGSLRVEF
jgi:iron complex outermembrane receptor protein